MTSCASDDAPYPSILLDLVDLKTDDRGYLKEFTLDDGKIGTEDQMVGWGEPMQIVGPGGNAQETYFFYDPSLDPDEKAKTFYWGDSEGHAVDVTFQPGDGFAIENGSADDYTAYDIKIACPYSL